MNVLSSSFKKPPSRPKSIIIVKIEEIQKMRDAGMKAHEAGDHAKSEELLNKALELIKS